MEQGKVGCVMRKYDFTGETLEWYGRTLNRIRALKDFCLPALNASFDAKGQTKIN